MPDLQQEKERIEYKSKRYFYLFAVSIFVIFMATAAGIFQFIAYANKTFRIQLLLESIEAEGHHLETLEWHAIGKKADLGKTLQEYIASNKRMNELLDEMATLAPVPVLLDIHETYHKYDTLINTNMNRISKGEIAAASKFRSSTIDPLFATLLEKIMIADDHYEEKAKTVQRISLIGILSMMLISFWMIIIAAWKFRQMFQRAHHLFFTKQELESAIAKRTEQLASSNKALHDEIAFRKELEVELKKRENLYRAIVEDQSELICRWKPDGTLTFVNDAYCRYFGQSRQALIGNNFSILIPEKERDSLMKNIREMVASLTPDNPSVKYEHRVVNATGMVCWQEWTDRGIFDEAKKLYELQSVGRDITYGKLVDEEVFKLSSAIEQSPNGVVITDVSGRVEYVNRAYKDRIGDTFENIATHPNIFKTENIPPDTFTRLWDTITAGRLWKGEIQSIKKSGGTMWEYVHISPIKDADGSIKNFLMIREDITDRKKLEEQLRQAQKLQAVGTLTGGVAHDFRNILTAIGGFSYIARDQLKAAGQTKRNAHVTHLLDNISEAVKRGDFLIQGLLSFSRKQIIAPRDHNLNDIITRVSKLLPSLLGEHITMQLVVEARDLQIFVDESKMDQVIINLATNARDAMPEGGIITIKTDMVTRRSDSLLPSGEPEIRDYAMLSVTDTGCGIEDHLKERIFEPFFTTKSVGKGTGLGLSIVYGIVKQHEGFLEVASNVPKGTIFNIYLPIVKRTSVEMPAMSVDVQGGSETLLLVEDDLAVLESTRMILEKNGYAVIVAQDGDDGVNKFKLHRHKIALTILDVMMPRKTGKLAADEIRLIDPDASILFISGYTSDLLGERGVLAQGTNFMYKSADPKDLMAKIREILDKKSK